MFCFRQSRCSLKLYIQCLTLNGVMQVPFHKCNLRKTNIIFCYVHWIVHYRAWSESTQHKFEDTWQEQRPLELVLGKGMHN